MVCVCAYVCVACVHKCVCVLVGQWGKLEWGFTTLQTDRLQTKVQINNRCIVNFMGQIDNAPVLHTSY